MFEAINLAILIGAGLIAISTFTSLISFRIGAPLLLVFLGVGLFAGEDGPGGLEFDNARVAYFIGSDRARDHSVRQRLQHADCGAYARRSGRRWCWPRSASSSPPA